MGSYYVKLTMLAHNKRTEAHYFVTLESLGMRKGQEVSISQPVPDGGVTALVNHLKYPYAAVGHMTFAWDPPDGQQTLFRQLTKDTLDFEITAGIYNDKRTSIIAEDTFIVDNIHIKHISHGDPKRKSLERVDVTYNKVEVENKD